MTEFEHNKHSKAPEMLDGVCSECVDTSMQNKAAPDETWKQTQENTLSEPVFKDEYFRKKPKKHGREWQIIDCPETFVPIADTHAHLQMLADPALAIARAAVHKVGFIEAMVDPGDVGEGKDESVPRISAEETFQRLSEWCAQAEVYMRSMSTRICGQGHNHLPKIRISTGVHPHNAKRWVASLERRQLELMSDARTSAVGEIGLDYHYDYSPKKAQQEVFARQVELAHKANLPIILHIREAFDDAFDILREVGWGSAGVLLHCYTSDESEIKRWIDAGCYIAFGGAFTFKKLDEVRLASKLVPKERLLTETDAPFMTPEPFRGISCEPGHVVFTAQRMFDYIVCDDAPCGTLFSDEEDARRSFFTTTFENALRLLDRPQTNWQKTFADRDNNA